MRRMTMLAGPPALPMAWLIAALVLVMGLAGPGSTAKAAAAFPLIENKVTVDGAERSYAYYVSPKANSWTGGYLVLALHDNGQTAEQFAEQSGWAKLADQYGFAVVFPKADKGAWSAMSRGEDEYLSAVYADARAKIISRFPGDRAPAPQGGGEGAPRRVLLLPTHTQLTGSGAGAVVAEEFAINHPGMIASLATVNGTAFPGAYAKGDDRAEDIFQYGRGKVTLPVTRQLKKDVPVATWLFNATAQSPALTRQANYWKRSNAVGAAAQNAAVGGFQTATFRNPQNEAQQVRTTVLPAGAKYDEALASTIWNELFSRTARWTSSPNGDLAKILSPTDFDKGFEPRAVDVGGTQFKYYVKLPSSYKKGGPALPVVVSLHGGAQPVWLYAGQIRMHEVGEKAGFITVYPAAAQRNMWTAADFNGVDARGIEALVGDLVATYGADKSRIYLQGFSVGSRMTYTTALTRPQLFAAMAPNSGFPPFTPEMQKRIVELKAEKDYRMPTYALYGAADTDASQDGKIPAKGQLAGAIDAFKAYNKISTADRAQPYDALYTAPYDALVPGGKLVRAGVDKSYPAGRFQVYEYMSADPKPLNLLDFAMVTDMPHSSEPRQAQMVWDYFRHWSRNPDGTVAYRP